MPAKSRICSLLAKFLLLLLSLTPNRAHAQSQVVLGDSAVELTGPWKFHIGDNPRFADPTFDDASWHTIDLTPADGLTDYTFGSSVFVPGWTTQGYAGHTGFAWYRLRVAVLQPATANSSQKSGPPRALSLKMPLNVDDGYQVYVNGRFLGQFGEFTGNKVSIYSTQPRTFNLPSDLIGKGPVTFAIRMYMDPATPLFTVDAGGMHSPPIVGQATVIDGLTQLDWDNVNQSYFFTFFDDALFLLVMIIAFSLYALDRSEPAYLWLALLSLLRAINESYILHSTYTTTIPVNLDYFVDDAILFPLQIVLWIIFWGHWFRIAPMRRLHVAAWGLGALLVISTCMERPPFYGWIVPLTAIVWVRPLVLVCKLLLGALLIYVNYRGIRKNRTEGLLALPVVLLVFIARYQVELRVLHVRTLFYPFGYGISFGQITTMLSITLVTILLLRRFLQTQRQRAEWELEIEQARQLQQVLIPASVPTIAGFQIQSEYHPAQQVGGDFFQILPEKDGRTLVIVGDVSGKGLKAAMLVSMIVGAIRTLAETTRTPLEMLEGINRRLCGHVGGQFATCVALQISSDGNATLANAGHLPPYWNGAPMEIAGSLPLGLAESAEFEQMHFTMHPSDQLVLITDGILEAQNKRDELFGFDRTAALMQQHLSALEIAIAAQAFGQEDDITVLRLVRHS